MVSAPIQSCETFDVPIIDDDILEDDSQFLELLFLSPSPHIDANNSQLMHIIITDNDSKYKL